MFIIIQQQNLSIGLSSIALGFALVNEKAEALLASSSMYLCTLKTKS